MGKDSKYIDINIIKRINHNFSKKVDFIELVSYLVIILSSLRKEGYLFVLILYACFFIIN